MRSLFISIFEIRCEGGKEERVFDLSPNGVDLTMHRSTLKGLHEQLLYFCKRVTISDWRHGEFVISQAILRRATSPTNTNSQSRSSTYKILYINSSFHSNGEVNDQANDGVLSIVDLAGAEREKRTGNQVSLILLESNFINKTSVVFCLCLRVCSLKHQKNPLKPLEKHFQDSLLTKYLRAYMEGNKRMALILTVKAGGEDYHNTSCLLRQSSLYMEIKFNNEPSKRRPSPSFVLKGYKEKLEVPLSLEIRIAPLRGTLQLHIKPPPSDWLWFAFTSMPDIDFSLDSSVGDHKIASGRIALFLISRLKTAIRETLVLPNFESVCIPWMLAEKDDWLP
ncbi:unnamed protein product [Prunus brigantina]